MPSLSASCFLTNGDARSSRPLNPLDVGTFVARGVVGVGLDRRLLAASIVGAVVAASLAGEGLGGLAGDQLVEQGTERVDIGANIDVRSGSSLLRAHVLERAKDVACLRQPLVLVRLPSNTEVCQQWRVDIT